MVEAVASATTTVSHPTHPTNQCKDTWRGASVGHLQGLNR